MPFFCKWEYSGVSNWEAAYCSKGLQSLKVSNIWAFPLMALPCNGYKLNLLTSASICHMALCSLCRKMHSNCCFHWKKRAQACLFHVLHLSFKLNYTCLELASIFNLYCSNFCGHYLTPFYFCIILILLKTVKLKNKSTLRFI